MNDPFQDPFAIHKLGRLRVLITEIENGFLAAFARPGQDTQLLAHFYFKTPDELGPLLARYIAVEELEK